MKNSLLTAAAAAASLWFASPASADVIYDFTTGGNGNANQSGTAEFDFSGANAFTLTLTNTSNMTSIASILDGVTFTLSGTLTTLTLNSTSDQGTATCTASGCVTTAAGSDSHWILSTSGNDATLGASGSALHPYGIANDSLLTNFGLDGLTNAQHNPMLLGPVVFSFTSTGETSIPTISNFAFLFGTVPDIIDGVPTEGPEPATLALLGAGLVGLGLIRRRRKAA